MPERTPLASARTPAAVRNVSPEARGVARMGRIVALAFIALVCASAFAGGFPSWAYPVDPPDEPSLADGGRYLHVPDSPLSFSRRQLEAIDGPVPDWHPDEHPPMPAIVGKGRPPAVYACAYCHLPNGAGRPENASLAGLTAPYIVRQVLAFRNGDRPGSEPRRGPQDAMIALARAATIREIEEAAAYFASLKPAGFVRVVEAARVPKSMVAGWTLTPLPGGGREPIGNRIIEMATDFLRFENRDSRVRFVAFAPPGSIALGAALAANGAQGRSAVCATCHGPGMRGLLEAPRLAGRSPSYLARQLHDFRGGKRKGPNAELMRPVAARLTDGDIVALAAYLASIPP